MFICMTFRSPFKSGPALASRLCKAAMLSRFNLVAKEAQREELLAAFSYREAKVLHLTELFPIQVQYMPAGSIHFSLFYK